MSRPIRQDDELLTLEEFLALPEEESRLELSRGRLIREPPPATYHGRIQTRLAAALLAYEEATDRGIAIDGSAFILSVEGSTVRGPDLSFVVKERIPRDGYPSGLWRIAPDLAVEILSPSNRPRDIQEKIVDYLEFGVRMIWIVDPDARTATVYRPQQDPFIVRAHESLDGGAVLPGFTVPLERLFRP